jgi:probable F420-dependent oxidoreductase
VQVGVYFPQTELGPDPATVRRFALAVQEAGFSFLMPYDHVLGADTSTRPRWSGSYDHRSLFHEPFVLLGFVAAFTTIDLVTGVIVLPQRQTALVAKQAAELDVLSGGRLRLGVGIGWNAVEYEALGTGFDDRATRYEEQVAVLRLLWTHDVVDFDGAHHRIDRAGLNPLPVQRPIPLWMGTGRAPAALRRVGRLADGWLSPFRVGHGFEEALAVVRDSAEEHGRAVDVQGILDLTNGIDELRRQLDLLEQGGATHACIWTERVGLTGAAHVDVVHELGAALHDRLKAR